MFLQVIAQCQDRLVPRKANIMVLSKRHEIEGICTEKEQWYQTPYCVQGEHDT